MQNHLLKKTMITAAAGAVAALLAGADMAAQAQSLPGEGKTALPVRPNWDSFWFGQKIMDLAMERLGYEVKEPATLAGPAIFTSLAQGDAHYTADMILPNHASMYAEVEDRVMAIGPIMDPGTLQGYLIDRKTAEEHNIQYVEDLLDPEIAKLFDSDGDGRADMVGPSVGWGAETVALYQFEALDLDRTVRMVQGEYTALSADAAARFNAGQPVLIYAWYPNPTTLQLQPGRDLVWLQMRDLHLPDDQAEQYQPRPDVVGCAGGSNPCNIGWLPTVYFVAVNREWAQDNPAAVEFFNQVEMHLDSRVQQNIRMAAGENREEDILRHAQEWIAENQDRFDAWIEKAIEVGNQ